MSTTPTDLIGRPVPKPVGQPLYTLGATFVASGGTAVPRRGTTRKAMNDETGLFTAAALIKSTDKFDDVSTSAERDSPPVMSPRAVLRLTGWKTTDAWSGQIPEEKLREVRFEVTITVRPGEGSTTQELAQAVERALSGQPLGDSLPAMTRVEEGRYAANNLSPERSVTVLGSFAYLI